MLLPRTVAQWDPKGLKPQAGMTLMVTDAIVCCGSFSEALQNILRFRCVPFAASCRMLFSVSYVEKLTLRID
jgi:hypothetical protein